MTIILVFVSLSILILVHELGHFGAAKFFGVRVEEFGFGFPPRIYGKKIGETIYSINALPLGGFVRIPGEDGDVEATDGRTFVDKPAWQRVIMLVSGVFMNIVAGWIGLTIVFMIGSAPHLIISGIAKDSPAEAVGLKSGDLVLSAGRGEIKLVDPIKADDFSNLFKTLPEAEVSLKIMRGEETLEMKAIGRVIPPVGEGPLGVVLSEVGFAKSGFFSSLVKGVTATGEILKGIFQGFYILITQAFSHPEILSAVSGPIGIFSLAGDASHLGFVYFLQLMALISLNLAVLNLIPFPALDGGRVLLLLIEKIRGKNLSLKFQMIFNSIGFFVLILLMIIVSVKDIRNLF